MSLKQYEYFLKAVECSSINKAANQLGITQQALRSSLNALEKQLGFLLLRRSKSGVSLTGKGEAVLDDIQRVVSILNKMKEFSEWNQATQCTIRISATATAINTVMLPVVRDCRNRFPHLRLELHEVKIGDFFPRLQERMLGVICAVPHGNLEAYRTILQTIGVELESVRATEFQVVVNPRHRLASGRALTLAQLKRFTIAMYNREQQTFYYGDIHKYFSSNAPYCLPLQESIFALVAGDPSTAAIYPSPASRQNSFRFYGLKAMPVSDYPMPADICLAYPKETSTMEKAVLGIIRERILAMADHAENR
ncbi:LysR family transcriptional regulator [Mailhella sp.]|uniref:LysR family transcriptional regulator n=1 Tax=Mailhella sp. TaxID=1981029 RepID=UPI003AB713AD